MGYALSFNPMKASKFVKFWLKYEGTQFCFVSNPKKIRTLKFFNIFMFTIKGSSLG